MDLISTSNFKRLVLQVGAFERDPEKIAGVLADWLGPHREEFEAMALRAKAIGMKWQNALFRIVEDLAAMVSEEPSPNSIAGTLESQRSSWDIRATA